MGLSIVSANYSLAVIGATPFPQAFEKYLWFLSVIYDLRQQALDREYPHNGLLNVDYPISLTGCEALGNP